MSVSFCYYYMKSRKNGTGEPLFWAERDADEQNGLVDPAEAG